MVGHISFLVSCTRQNLEFAYAKLSKFVVYPGVKHMCAAERTLQYIMGTYDKRLTYSSLDSRRRNVLEGWVDSDFASDPDTRKSVTGYVMSFNGAPLSWEAKRQGRARHAFGRTTRPAEPPHRHSHPLRVGAGE
mmetsp:Transcript_31190/g.48260  ORF Transcript_31190/g.48260 Transcript_31190/m.48260 type:complete len:134 (+) Transcript_31190:1090-1491(+)